MEMDALLDDVPIQDPVYFKTDNSFGMASNEDNVPPGAEVITRGEYDALMLDAQQAEEERAHEELQAAYGRYVTAYQSYRQLGLPEMNARLLAAQIGIEPPDFDPTWPLP